MSDLERVVRNARKVAKDLKDHAKVCSKNKEESMHRDSEVSVMGEWEGPGMPLEEFKLESGKKKRKGKSYDLWADLGALKTDITFGKLLEISTIARKTLKEGMSVVRRKWRARTRIATRAQLPGGSSDVKAVEIEATIVDKVVPNVLIGVAD